MRLDMFDQVAWEELLLSPYGVWVASAAGEVDLDVTVAIVPLRGVGCIANEQQ